MTPDKPPAGRSVSSTMDQVNSNFIRPQDMTDEEIANIIKAQATRHKERLCAKGVLSYQPAEQSSSSLEVNKTFFARTIVSVSAHNRREEEDQCYRQRTQSEIAEKMFPKRGAPRVRPRSSAALDSRISKAQGNSRSDWAALKAISSSRDDRLKPNNEVSSLFADDKLGSVSIMAALAAEKDQPKKKQRILSATDQDAEDDAERKKRKKSEKREKKKAKKEKKKKKKELRKKSSNVGR